MTPSHPDGVTLSEFMDDALAPASRADVAAHVETCRECRAIVDGLRDVQAAARRLRPLEPPAGAWDHIERAIRHGHAGSVRRVSIRWPWLAAAAALVLATYGGWTVSDWRRQRQAVVATGTTAEPTAQSIEAELLQAEQHYQNAIAGLEQIANSEKGSLDPQTASTLEKNLTVIDQAISESRAAVRAQPASEPAQASLLESFKSKIALLQDTVALINEMRITQKGT